ncbi:hypothetical protein GE061_001552 [Apolygus lucorum]|uniref:Copia protein n=1 Tax=Apolygus lucorum TaxID=248454 RepID=A0A8S9YAS2_APOLU|nr:hypothetical protein GE061_001552 [Apolygus lucorum]
MSGAESPFDRDISNVEKLADLDSFPMWKFEINILFESKNLVQIVDGTVDFASLTTDKERAEWKLKDAKARQAIVGSLDRKHRIHLLSCSTSKEMYDKMCKIFERGPEHQQTASLEMFFSYKFDPTKDVATNISSLENLAFRINSLKANKVDDEMLVAKIVSSLPSS